MGIFHEVMSGALHDAYEQLTWREVYPGMDETASGASVNERTAMTIADVWKCVRVRSESFATLPKKLYEKARILGRDGRREAQGHPLFRLIHARPNPSMPSFAFFELVSSDLDTWGNFYAYIERATRGTRITGLWRIQPHMLRVENKNGQIWYVAEYGDGRKPDRFYPDEILHVRGLGYDGFQGYSPIRVMMDAMGWAKSTSDYGARFFRNGARPSGLLISDVALEKTAKEKLKESFAKFHSGENAHKIALVEGGLKWQGLTMPNDEAQFLESLDYHQANIAGIYRVPLHKIQNLKRATNNNIEHQDIEWVRDTIEPICNRVEQWFDHQLLSEQEQARFYMECELKGLLRGDTAAQTQHNREMFNIGVYSQNDILEDLNKEPIEGGDEHWVPLNMIPLSMAKELLTQRNAQPAPSDTAGDTTDDASDDEPSADEIRSRVQNELQARIRASYGRIFRDAVGRILARKPEDRPRVLQAILFPTLCALAECYTPSLSADGADSIAAYISEMSERAAEWTADDADTIARLELTRAMMVLAERFTDETKIPL